MSNGHFAYMRPEKGGKIEKIALASWGRYRSSGYVFVENGEEEYQKQQAELTPAEVEAAAEPAKKKKKKKKVIRRT
jgi:hypothetical protein